jgi:hypothetical protein
MTAGYPPASPVHRAGRLQNDTDTKLVDQRPSGRLAASIGPCCQTQQQR